MQRVLARTGGLLLAVFIATGVYLKYFVPEAHLEDPAFRHQLRANHVYILMASLVSLAFSTVAPCVAVERRARICRAGSILLLVASAIILVAFVVDPPRAPPHRWLTNAGVVWLAAGVFMQMASKSQR